MHKRAGAVVRERRLHRFSKRGHFLYHISTIYCISRRQLTGLLVVVASKNSSPRD
jgi:hypothetical protein